MRKITKLVVLFIAVFLSLICLHCPPVVAAEGIYFDVIFNETGTHIHNGNLKIRLDLYPRPEASCYEKYNLYLPVIPENATDEQRHDDKYLSALPHEYVLTPAVAVFVKVEKDINWAGVQSYISRVFTGETTSTLDDILTSGNALHEISPFMRDKTEKTVIKQVLNGADIIDVNERLKDMPATPIKSGLSVQHAPGSIEVGNDAINRSTYSVGLTFIDQLNPSAADGVIDSVEWYGNSYTGIWAGSYFNVSGSTWECRDSESLGNGTAYTLFTGLDIEIEAGDYIGGYMSGISYCDRDATGSALYTSYERKDPGDSGSYSPISATYSIKGTGDEVCNEPIAETIEATNITTGGARLSGNITNLTCANTSSIIFEWGPLNGVYVDNVTDNSSFGNIEVYYDLEGIAENTTVHFRFGAKIEGSSYQYGDDKYFTTLSSNASGETGGITVSNEFLILILLCVLSLGLMMVNFFRVNIMFTLAALAVNIAITQVPGVPLALIWAALLISVGEVAALIMKVAGNKNHKRFTG